MSIPLNIAPLALMLLELTLPNRVYNDLLSGDLAFSGFIVELLSAFCCSEIFFSCFSLLILVKTSESLSSGSKLTILTGI